MKFNRRLKLSYKNIINSSLFLYILSLYLLTYKDGLNNISNALALILILTIWIEVIIIKKKLVFNKTLLFYFLFVIISTMSVLYAISPGLALVRVKTIISLFILILSLANYIDNYKKMELLMKYFIYSGLIASIYILSTSDFNNMGRLGSQLGNVNSIGIILGISAAFIIYFLTFQKKYTYYLYFIIISSTIFLTGSRMSFLFLIMNIVFYIYFIYGRGIKNKLKFIFFSTCLFILFLYLIFNIPFFYNIIGERIERLILWLSGESVSENSIYIRFKMIKEGWRMFKEKPILGYGLNNYQVLYAEIKGGVATYAHNNFIELLVSIGIIGTGIFYLMQILIVIDLIKTSKKIRNEFLIYIFIALTIAYIFSSIATVYYYRKQFSLILIMASLVPKIIVKKARNHS